MHRDPTPGRRAPRTRLAIVNDYELIVAGLHDMLQPYQDVLQFVELQAGKPAEHAVDVALYDSFAMGASGWGILDQLIQDPSVSETLVYTTYLSPEHEQEVLHRGARGVLSKAATAQEVVEAVLAAQQGRGPGGLSPRTVESGRGNWPGKAHGLSEREAETLALICQGLSNVEIAERLILTLNTVKTYIRSSYRKIGATTRSEAVLWGSQNGFASTNIPLPRLENGQRP